MSSSMNAPIPPAAPESGAKGRNEPVITEEDLAAFDTSDGHATAIAPDDAVNRLFYRIGAFIAIVATVIIVLLVAVSVTLRYFFNSSLPIAAEGPTYFFPWLIAGGAMVAQSQRGHVAVDALVARLHGPRHDKAQIAIWAFVTLLLGYLTYLAAYMIPPMAAQSTPIMGWPQLGSFGAFILMAAVLTIQAASRTINYIRHGAPHASENYDVDSPVTKGGTGA